MSECKWISVADRLPPIDGKPNWRGNRKSKLVMIRNNYLISSALLRDNLWGNGFVWKSPAGMIPVYVTHWMEIPEIEEAAGNA